MTSSAAARYVSRGAFPVGRRRQRTSSGRSNWRGVTTANQAPPPPCPPTWVTWYETSQQSVVRVVFLFGNAVSSAFIGRPGRTVGGETFASRSGPIPSEKVSPHRRPVEVPLRLNGLRPGQIPRQLSRSDGLSTTQWPLPLPHRPTDS